LHSITIKEIKSLFNYLVILKDIPSDWKAIKLAVPFEKAIGLPNVKNNHSLSNP
jgi:hypothetical protein